MFAEPLIPIWSKRKSIHLFSFNAHVCVLLVSFAVTFGRGALQQEHYIGRHANVLYVALHGSAVSSCLHCNTQLIANTGLATVIIRMINRRVGKHVGWQAEGERTAIQRDNITISVCFLVGLAGRFIYNCVAHVCMGKRCWKLMGAPVFKSACCDLLRCCPTALLNHINIFEERFFAPEGLPIRPYSLSCVSLTTLLATCMFNQNRSSTRLLHPWRRKLNLSPKRR
jgi:hypothetical protein